jgi:hypothetical protein
MSNELSNMHFYCPLATCEASVPPKDAPTFPRALGMNYKTALKHLETCEETPRDCKLGCSELVKQSEIEAHGAQCKKFSTPCEKCGQSNFLNDPEYIHDCIEELKKSLQVEDGKLLGLQKSLGLDLKTTCPAGHDVKV